MVYNFEITVFVHSSTIDNELYTCTYSNYGIKTWIGEESICFASSLHLNSFWALIIWIVAVLCLFWLMLIWLVPSGCLMLILTNAHLAVLCPHWVLLICLVAVLCSHSVLFLWLVAVLCSHSVLLICLVAVLTLALNTSYRDSDCLMPVLRTAHLG